MQENENGIIEIDSIIRDYMMDQLDNLRAYFDNADYEVERIEATSSSMKLQVKLEDKRYSVVIQSLLSEVE